MNLPNMDKNLPTFLADVRSASFLNTLNQAGRVAKFDSSVLLSGDTGVGKEVIARYIHWLSPRKANPMLTINCSALPETLLESELFGHKAGSYTGAFRDRVGLFEQAARGTVFLDEIGDISKATQIKLLRVLQEREILRIGENIPRKVDIRIIAATNSDLDIAVAEAKFRIDLLYRLRVVEIKVPQLRERPEDIVPLTDYFIARLAKRLNLPDLGLDKECLALLQSYAWPGNVRELQNALEYAAIMSGDGAIRSEHLPLQITHPGRKSVPTDIHEYSSLAEMELDYISSILNVVNGNRKQAAEILGIGVTTLWRKLKQLEK